MNTESAIQPETKDHGPKTPRFVGISEREYFQTNQFTGFSPTAGGLLALMQRCREGRPLVILNTFIGYGAEMRPEQLRALAAKLVTLAEDAERYPMGKRSFRPAYRRY